MSSNDADPSERAKSFFYGKAKPHRPKSTGGGVARDDQLVFFFEERGTCLLSEYLIL